MAKKLWYNAADPMANWPIVWLANLSTQSGDPEPYYSEDCCCVVDAGDDCAGICTLGTTPLEVELTIQSLPYLMPELCEETGCSWLEGMSFILAQDDVDPCKWCTQITNFCDNSATLDICFFLTLQNTDEVWGRIEFQDAPNGVTSIEWRIDPTSPITCADVDETVTSSTTPLAIEDNATLHDCRYADPGFSYRVRAL